MTGAETAEGACGGAEEAREDAIRAALIHAAYYSAYPSAAVSAFTGALTERGYSVVPAGALKRLGRPRQLPQTYTVLDPDTGRVKLNPDGTPFLQHYATYLVGQEDIAAIRAALGEPDATD